MLFIHNTYIGYLAVTCTPSACRLANVGGDFGRIGKYENTNIIKTIYNNYVKSSYYINLKKILKNLFESLLDLLNKSHCLT